MKMKTVSLTALLLCLSAGPLLASEGPDRRLSKAATAFNEIMSAPDKGIPTNLLNKADCVVIVPGLVKAGFIIGGEAGKGVITCRGAGGTGWTAPAMLEMGGGSVGFQIGAESTDVVMLIMNSEGLASLLKSKFTLGADASVAAGPVGRTTTAETDVRMEAKILTYSRSKGVFAGVALKGMTLRLDDKENLDLYGKEVTAAQILDGQVAVPAGAKPLLDTLNRYSPRARRGTD